MDPIRPTLLDRAIAAVSPARGAKRLADRASFNAIAAAVTEPGGRIDRRGGYRGGQSDRRQTRQWSAKPRSANSDALGHRKELVGRSRDAAMNLAPAAAAIERNVTFSIGTGLMAIPDLDGEKLGLTPEDVAALTGRIMRDYDNYMSSTDPDAERNVTGYGQQEIVLRGMLESGDILGLRCWPEKQVGRVHMTAWKLVEGDRVVSPASHVARDGERLNGDGPVVVAGVEQDEYGAAVAFHALTKAPDPYNTARRPGDTKRYEAWGAKSKLPGAVLVFDKRRPEQARGVPFLAPVLELIKIFSDTTDAAALSLLLQSMLAIVYKSPGAGSMPEPDYGAGEIVQSEGEPEVLQQRSKSDFAIEAGLLLEIDSDSEVEVKSPGRDNPAHDKFFETLMTMVGAATGTPFGVLMARFNNSYTASKGEIEVFYKEVVRRIGRFAPDWCDPHYRCWLYERVAAGIYDMPGFLDDLQMREAWCSVRWAGDGKISLDPYRERRAFEIDEAHGWQTGQQITAQINGGDHDANIERRIMEHRKFVDGGLPIPNQQGGGSRVADDPDGQQREESGDDKDE